MPSGDLPQPYPCGVEWDAVSVGFVDGYRVVGMLGQRSGAVIEDAEGGRVTWLVKPGAAGGWCLPGVAVRGLGLRLLVPPLTPPKTAILRWAVRPGTGFLTCHTALYGALVYVTGARPDPRVVSTYTSPECLTNGHEACTKGEVRPTPPGCGVVEEPCGCGCHGAGGGR
ncbi:hypothetical protein [Streptomyces specialis]|uniref:hypothetical protein n=1 Tax=Streptomyces specialis TaxID=498367 RepID=UPI00073F4B43|nr:hypothetical protein [Streptomyces specialis]